MFFGSRIYDNVWIDYEHSASSSLYETVIKTNVQICKVLLSQKSPTVEIFDKHRKGRWRWDD